MFLELSLLNYFHRMWFSLSCLGVQAVFDTTSAFFRQYAIGVHSSRPAISLFYICSDGICTFSTKGFVAYVLKNHLRVSQ